MFAIMRFHYIEVLNFEPYILLITEVKNIIHYTKEIVIWRFVKSRSHCNDIFIFHQQSFHVKYNDYNIFICLMLNFILDCTRAYTKNMSGTHKLHVHSVFYMFYFIMVRINFKWDIGVTMYLLHCNTTRMNQQLLQYCVI